MQAQRVDREGHAVVDNRNVVYGEIEIPYIQIGKVDAVAFGLDVVFPVTKIHVPNLYGTGLEAEWLFFSLFFLPF